MLLVKDFFSQTIMLFFLRRKRIQIRFDMGHITIHVGVYFEGHQFKSAEIYYRRHFYSLMRN